MWTVHRISRSSFKRSEPLRGSRRRPGPTRSRFPNHRPRRTADGRATATHRNGGGSYPATGHRSGRWTFFVTDPLMRPMKLIRAFTLLEPGPVVLVTTND